MEEVCFNRKEDLLHIFDGDGFAYHGTNCLLQKKGALQQGMNKRYSLGKKVEH